MSQPLSLTATTALRASIILEEIDYVITAIFLSFSLHGNASCEQFYFLSSTLELEPRNKKFVRDVSLAR
jgi:hypothetical protein